MNKKILTALVAAFAVLGPVSQAQAQWICTAQAKALFGHGPKLGQTRGYGEGWTRREACAMAKDECRYRLDIKRDNDGFGYPAAKCKRVNARHAQY
ncbi:MAG: hypothetical protein AAFV45_13830 [Pseudomonadota bacterium]